MFGSGAIADAYAIGGASPELVAAFTTASDGTTAGEYFRKAGSETTFGDLFTFSRSGTATYFDSNGTLQTAADGVARRQAYRYNSGWELAGMQMEAAAATQLLHGTDSFATQTETVTAQAYTLQFRGTGSITLFGAHLATLNGTGANDLVSLTFTPSAGTLTLTPAGTVNYPQLETGSIPSSYIPNPAASGTVTRAAETLTIAGADTPFNTTGFTVYEKGFITYADNNSGLEAQLARINQDANNNHEWRLSTTSTATGIIQARVEAGGTIDTSQTSNELTPGVNVAFAIASRYTSSELQVALNGTAATANTGIPSITDMSATAFEPLYNFNGYISELRYWGTDLAESGIAEVTT